MRPASYILRKWGFLFLLAGALVPPAADAGVTRGDAHRGEVPAAVWPSPVHPPLASFQQERIPRQSSQRTAAIQGIVRDAEGRGIGGAKIMLSNLATGGKRQVLSNAEGVFRLLELPPGRYELRIESEGHEPYAEAEISLASGEAIVREVKLKRIPGAPAVPSGEPRLPQMAPPAEASPAERYP
jgi:hypothetical protein